MLSFEWIQILWREQFFLYIIGAVFFSSLFIFIERSIRLQRAYKETIKDLKTAEEMKHSLKKEELLNVCQQGQNLFKDFLHICLTYQDRPEQERENALELSYLQGLSRLLKQAKFLLKASLIIPAISLNATLLNSWFFFKESRESGFSAENLRQTIDQGFIWISCGILLGMTCRLGYRILVGHYKKIALKAKTSSQQIAETLSLG